jgi:HEAT repeat protein
LTDKHENVANAALLALARLVRQNQKDPLTKQPNRAAIESLLELINGDSDASVRERAIMALGRLGVVTPDAVEALVKQLAEGDADVRRAAAESLGQVGSYSNEATLALVKAISDQEDAVSTAAARALGQIAMERRRWGQRVQARAARDSKQSR